MLRTATMSREIASVDVILPICFNLSVDIITHRELDLGRDMDPGQ